MTSSPQPPQPIERPTVRIHPVTWIRKNLFSSWFNSLLTLLTLLFIYTVLFPFLTWIFTQARWDVVAVNIRLFLVGTFPAQEIWRVWTCVVLASGLLGLSWRIWPQVAGGVAISYGSMLLFLALLPFAPSNRIWLVLSGSLIFVGFLVGRKAVSEDHPTIRRWVAFGWLILLIVIIWLLSGLGITLPIIKTTQWGGLLLTLILAITSIVLSFPLGVLLAIGRRSSYPVISLFCTMFIELIRGVPLVTVLFMFQIMLPLFIPGGENIDKVVRAIVGFTLFTSAYIAENVRGGLQAIPKGQFEAARALGLNPLLTMLLIILPQALRIVIPANVSQFVSLFKDTSLVFIASLLDLLGVGRSVLGQSEFLGYQTEVYLFVGAVYWVFAYSLTYVSRRLEDVLGVRHR